MKRAFCLLLLGLALSGCQTAKNVLMEHQYFYSYSLSHTDSATAAAVRSAVAEYARQRRMKQIEQGMWGCDAFRQDDIRLLLCHSINNDDVVQIIELEESTETDTMHQIRDGVETVLRQQVGPNAFSSRHGAVYKSP